MAYDWSIVEVEATVADYLYMLRCELQGIPYNKSEHRRQLLQKLNGRSEGAIERKRSNISTVLIELGFPYIAGYKPLPNIQGILRKVVASQLDADQSLADIAMEQVTAESATPAVEDILGALVAPPEPIGAPSEVRELSFRPRKIDFLQLEARNRSLGQAGEEFAMRFEQARLIAANREVLAEKIERVSKTQGDGLGFDIRSFETDGKDRFIEVKTTAYGALTPFYVTSNELAASVKLGGAYHLYRPFAFRRSPRIFCRQGPLDKAFGLVPSAYRALIV